MKLLRFGALSLVAVIAPSAVLVEHNYDPLGDHVIALPLRPGEHLTQSFTAPESAASAVAIRFKIERLGEPGPLHYRIGAALGSDDIATGEIAPDQIQPYFESFDSLPFRNKQLRPGLKYFVEFDLGVSNHGYYQLFGTKAGAEGPINIDYGAVTPNYGGGQAYDTSGRTITGTELAFQLIGPDDESTHTQEPFEFITDLIAPIHYRRASYVKSPISQADEVLLDNSWSLELSSSAGIATRTGAAEFGRFLNDEMGVKLARKATETNYHNIRFGLPFVPLAIV